MRSKIIKILSLVLVMVFALSVFVGCDSQKTPEDTATAVIKSIAKDKADDMAKLTGVSEKVAQEFIEANKIGSAAVNGDYTSMKFVTLKDGELNGNDYSGVMVYKVKIAKTNQYKEFEAPVTMTKKGEEWYLNIPQ